MWKACDRINSALRRARGITKRVFLANSITYYSAILLLKNEASRLVYYSRNTWSFRNSRPVFTRRAVLDILPLRMGCWDGKKKRTKVTVIQLSPSLYTIRFIHGIFLYYSIYIHVYEEIKAGFNFTFSRDFFLFHKLLKCWAKTSRDLFTFWLKVHSDRVYF